MSQTAAKEDAAKGNNEPMPEQRTRRTLRERRGASALAVTIGVRVTDADADDVVKAAEERGVPPAQWARAAILAALGEWRAGRKNEVPA